MDKQIIIDARAITSKKCGVREVAYNLLQNIKYVERYHIVIITNYKTNLNIQNSKEIVLPKFFSRFNVLGDLFLPFYVKINRNDILLSFHSWLPFLIPKKLKMFFILHDTFSFTDKNFFKNKNFLIRYGSHFFFYIITLFSLIRSKAVFCPSQYTINCARSKFDFINLKYIKYSNGIREFKSNYRNIKVEKRKEILYVGNFRSYKGFNILATAWKKIVDNNLDNGWNLVVIGNDKREKYLSFFSDNPAVLKKSKFLGQVDDETLFNYYDNCGLLVVPSNNEGFGMPILEGISRGCKIICSNCDAFNEFNEFKNLIYFNVNSIKDLTSKILFSIASNNYREIFDSNLVEKYNWENTSKEFWSNLDSNL